MFNSGEWWLTRLFKNEEDDRWFMTKGGWYGMVIGQWWSPDGYYRGIVTSNDCPTGAWVADSCHNWFEISLNIQEIQIKLNIMIFGFKCHFRNHFQGFGLKKVFENDSRTDMPSWMLSWGWTMTWIKRSRWSWWTVPWLSLGWALHWSANEQEWNIIHTEWGAPQLADLGYN